MTETYEQRIASVFEDTEENYSPSVKIGPIFLWAAVAGIIGGIVPFIWITDHPMLVTISSAIIFIILTAKPVLKRSIKQESDEQREAFITSMNKEKDKRLKMMHERQAYFSAVAEKYETFEEFAKTQKRWLEIMGIELYQENPSYLSLQIQLDYQAYETYHIIKGDNGQLTVSDIIWWQDLYCANSLLNISTGESADEEDIPRCY